MHHFFVESVDVNTVLLDEEESKHAVKSLRIKIGDTVRLIDGKGKYAFAKVMDNHHKKCELEVFEVKQIPPPSYYLHIAIAPTKNIDRFEWFLEKATEIGIQEITPIITENSERKIIKPERLQKILIAAMKQSGRVYLPKLNSLSSLEDILSIEAPLKFIGHCEEHEKKFLARELPKHQSALILIGPEGDFSTYEIKQARNHNFIEISLGNYRLRTETAGIVACQEFATINQVN